MRPPGRSFPLPRAVLCLVLCNILLSSIASYHVTLAADTHSSAIVVQDIVAALAVSQTQHLAAIVTTTSTRNGAAPTASSGTNTIAAGTPSSSPTPVPRRCRNCPAGSICFKNTQCVPLNLLCNGPSNTTTTTTATTATATTTPSAPTNATVATNLCTDITGPPSLTSPILCQDQLCFAQDFLPLPLPGVGKVNRNSSANCLPGNYFSLYGAPGSKRYTQSCVGQPGVQPATCEAWEYMAQGFCFLRTCGPGMSCEPPFRCNNSTTRPYGICISPDDNTDSGDNDSDSSSAKDRSILGLSIGICTLMLCLGVGATVWWIRKQRLKKARRLNGEEAEEDDFVSHGSNGKRSLLSTLGTCLDAFLCFGRAPVKRGNDFTAARDGGGVGVESRDGGSEVTGTTTSGGPRVVSVAESDGLLTTDHQSSLIFARRWRWNQGRHTDTGARERQRDVTELSDFEPLPVYHQGPELPSYRDRNTILLTPVVSEHDRAVDYTEAGDQATTATIVSAPIADTNNPSST